VSNWWYNEGGKDSLLKAFCSRKGEKRYYNLVYGYLPSLSFSFKETYNPSVQFSNLKDLRIYFYKLGKITY
jgi:hypothetical protein